MTEYLTKGNMGVAAKLQHCRFDANNKRFFSVYFFSSVFSVRDFKEMIYLSVENKKRPSLIIKFAIRGGIVFFLLLSGMRFYASFLEQKVAGISRMIEELSMQEMSLEQQLSTLKSSNRIYNYCKDTLKMQRSTNVGLINKYVNE